MFNNNFEFVSNLQYQVKSLTARVRAFESGDKYTSMKAASKAQLSAKDREIRTLQSELADAHARLVTMRHNWSQVFDDVEKEHAKELKQKEQEIEKWKERAFRAEGQRDEFRAKLKEKSLELYRVETELEEEKGRNLKLKAQINRDYENSSKSSSLKPNHKKIANNRVKTGKRPGGQFGHEYHPRKKHAPTNLIDIPAPKEYADSLDYKPTGRIITKQLVDIRLELVVDEYSTPEFRHVRTGQRVHADFPEGVVDDVNYGGHVKAFAFLLNNRCNVSVEKVSGFLADLTGGELKISTGMVNGLSGEFSRKTEADQKKAFADLLLSPVMHVDLASARVNGKNMNVVVCATPDGKTTLYFAREHKGHESVKGTPVQDYQNTMVHDHDITFYFYGGAHQDCLEHVLRYLKGSMDNEPRLAWNQRMRTLIQEMIHFRNCLGPDIDMNPNQIDPAKVEGFETAYDEILDLAKQEYEYEPPSKYYMDGFNLYKRMAAYKDSHLLFLHDRRVPPTNNVAERLLRAYKRKQVQVMAFRSWGGLDNLCDCLGTVASLYAQAENPYESVASIFSMPIDKTANIAG